MQWDYAALKYSLYNAGFDVNSLGIFPPEPILQAPPKPPSPKPSFACLSEVDMMKRKIADKSCPNYSYLLFCNKAGRAKGKEDPPK